MKKSRKPKGDNANGCQSANIWVIDLKPEANLVSLIFIDYPIECKESGALVAN